MATKKSCASCLRGKVLNLNNDILCCEKGIVSKDYSCYKYRQVPPIKPLLEKRPEKCINCENFVSSNSDNFTEKSMGICQLFSARSYDGNKKNPCSKFVKKQSREVS